MIYLIQTPYDETDPYSGYAVNSVFNIPDKIDVEERYKQWMLEKAKELDLVIHPHFYNAMNHKDNNQHLTLIEYKKAVREWNKYLKVTTIEYFIENILFYKRLNFKTIFG